MLVGVQSTSKTCPNYPLRSNSTLLSTLASPTWRGSGWRAGSLRKRIPSLFPPRFPACPHLLPPCWCQRAAH